MKLNKLGEIQWTSTNGGALADGSYSVIATKDGGYLAVGYTTSTGNGGRDIKAIKLNASGMVIWTKTYGGINNETAYSVCQMFDSSYVIVGSTKSFGAVDNDVYVIKTNTMGDTLWTKVYAGTGTDIAYAVYPCEERGFVVAGKTNSEGASGYDMLLMKIYDDGYLLWKKTYGGEGDQVAYDVKETKNFGFVLGGTTTISNRTNSYLVSVNDFGDSIYYQNYPANYNEEIRSICVTTENTFVFTGSNSDFTLLNVTGVKSCYIFFPRGIWFGQCWNFNSNNNILLKKQTMLINSSGQTWQEKVADFVSYCGAIQVHTVVLNNLEDIIRLGNQYLDGGTYYDFQNFPKDLGTCPCYPNDLAAPCQNCNTAEITGDTLRLRLKRLVELLHKDAHVSVVLAQWLDQDSLQYNKEIPATSCSTTVACNFALNYHSDETNLAHENHREILLAFNELNDPAGTTNLGFDGLMLDYEYFAPHYGVTWDGNGNPNDCDFFLFQTRLCAVANNYQLIY